MVLINKGLNFIQILLSFLFEYLSIGILEFDRLQHINIMNLRYFNKNYPDDYNSKIIKKGL